MLLALVLPEKAFSILFSFYFIGMGSVFPFTADLFLDISAHHGR
jgi:hypothetical protein